MQNTIVFITGRKGSGKTTRANLITQAALATGQRVIAVAPMGGLDVPGGQVVKSVKQLCAIVDDRSILVTPSDDILPAATFHYAFTAGNCWLIVDEVDMYLPNYQQVNNDLLRIIRYGRHRGVSLVAVCQRPANVLRDLTAQADHIICYSTREGRDLEYLSKRLTAQELLAVEQLQPFESRTFTF